VNLRKDHYRNKNKNKAHPHTSSASAGLCVVWFLFKLAALENMVADWQKSSNSESSLPFAGRGSTVVKILKTINNLKNFENKQ